MLSTKQRKKIVIAVVCLTIGIFPLLSGYYFYSQKNLASDATEVLNDLSRIDAQWNSNVLKVSGGLQGNFDKVAAVTQLLDRKLVELNKIVNKLHELADDPGKRESLLKYRDQYQGLLKKKTELIEDVKSQQAILTNSSRFLPYTLEGVNNYLFDDSAGNVRVTYEELQRVLDKIVVRLFGFFATLDNAEIDVIEQEILRLDEKIKNLSPGLNRSFNVFKSHITTILKQKQKGIDLYIELEALPIEQSNRNLNAISSEIYRGVLQTQQLYRYITVVYFSFYIVILSILVWFFMTNYKKLGKSNVELAKSNEEAQIQLVQAAKMAALGRMVAGVAHEINTPLAHIKATFEMLRDNFSTLESSDQFNHLNDEDTDEGLAWQDIQELLRDGMYGINKITEIVLTLRNFSRLDQKKATRVSLHENLNNTLMIAHYVLKNGVEVVKEYGDIPDIQCFPSQLNQVFLNIIINAAQAMAEKEGVSRLAIRTHSSEIEGYICVDIEDNGPGIPEEVIPSIFDLYYTTKDVDEGTGVGLSICYKIIKNHGGEIQVESTVGVGTTFTIVLPVKAKISKEIIGSF